MSLEISLQLGILVASILAIFGCFQLFYDESLNSSQVEYVYEIKPPKKQAKVLIIAAYRGGSGGVT